MLGNKAKDSTRIGKRVYFKEKRGTNTEAKYYIGTIIGTRECSRTESNIFGGNQRTWNDTSLLIETSDKRRVQAWELDTFEVEGK